MKTLSLFAVLVGSATWAQTATGYVDIHNHILSELAFGGAWLHGHVNGEEAVALASCDGGENHARASLGFLDAYVGKIAGSRGDTGHHPEMRGGYPNYEAWPRWDTITHQQVWLGHLKQAHEAGLTMLLASAVNFEPLCELMPLQSRKYTCDDFESTLRQLYAMQAIAARNASWMEIAYTPQDARRIVAEKKLAVVLSLEASHAFQGPHWRYKLASYHAAGARTLQIVHQLDNQMAGSARHNPMFRLFQWLLDVKRSPGIQALVSSDAGFQYDEEGNNLTGVTPTGMELLQEVVRLGLPIDVAHLSDRGVRQVMALSKEAGGFPFYLSHGHFRDMMDDGKFSTFEKSSRRWVLDAVRESGGMFGLRTGPEKTKAYLPTDGKPNPVPNDCGGSTKSFAQTYQYGVREVGIPVALSTDLNGFIQQLRPRFGNEEETCGASPVSKNERRAQQQAQTMPLGRPFDKTGLGHIGQAQDVVAELKNFGVDTSKLWQTTEAYIQMWEKAERLSAKLSKP